MSEDTGFITDVIREAVNTGREPREILEAMRDEGYISVDDETMAFWMSIVDRTYRRVRDVARGYTDKELQEAVARLTQLDHARGGSDDGSSI